jgi:hypothetical protein
MPYTKHYRATHKPAGTKEPTFSACADLSPQALTYLPNFVRVHLNEESDSYAEYPSFFEDLLGVMHFSTLNGECPLDPKSDFLVRGASCTYFHLWASNGKYEREFGDIDQSMVLPNRAAGVGFKTSTGLRGGLADVTGVNIPFNMFKGSDPDATKHLPQCSTYLTKIIEHENGKQFLAYQRMVRPMENLDRGLFYATEAQLTQGLYIHKADDVDYWPSPSEDIAGCYCRSKEAHEYGVGPEVGGTYVCVVDCPVPTLDETDCFSHSLGTYDKAAFEQFEKMDQDGLRLLYYLKKEEKALLDLYLEAKENPDTVTIGDSFSVYCWNAKIRIVSIPFYYFGYTTQAVFCPQNPFCSAEEVLPDLEAFANCRPVWDSTPPKLLYPTKISEEEISDEGFSSRFRDLWQSLQSHEWAGDAHPGNFGIMPTLHYTNGKSWEVQWGIVSIDFSYHCEGTGEDVYFSYDSDFPTDYSGEGRDYDRTLPFPNLLQYL